jgi:hypothetical protein
MDALGEIVPPKHRNIVQFVMFALFLPSLTYLSLSTKYGSESGRDHQAASVR